MADRYPAYYRKFQCSNSKCTDSCCKKWEIAIDPESLARYRKYAGPLAQRLREAIFVEPDGSSHFRLLPDGRCPFLNEQGLCDMILQMGEGALCQICTDHPRFYRDVNGIRECGVGLCCEEAARLILSGEEDDRLIGAQPPESDLSALRDRLLENSQALIEDWWADEFIWREDVLQALLTRLLQEEILSSLWREALQKLSRRLTALLSSRSLKRWEPDFLRLEHYFVFRHFLRAEEYEEPEEGILAEKQLLWFCLTLLYLLYALRSEEAGNLTFAERVNICKLFSQEVEYDEEILELLEDFTG